ncbi:MAG TPA: transposase [Treponema sp.]|nr:transposase [Treponema sp.]
MRRSRFLEDGARYHVTVRVNNKEMLLEPEEAKQLFETVLIRAKRRYSFSLGHFVLMGNHIHLIILPHSDESLSRIMQWILSVFALKYNKMTGRTGHFWGDRFFSSVLGSLQQYLRTFDYISQNPVKAGLTEHCSTWRYSGIYHLMRDWHFLVTDVSCFLD